MARIIVFGAGGRGGRAVAAEARRRGHEVTAVVRDPAAHPGLDAVAGDVTDPASVAALAAGHDAAVNSTYSPGADPAEFFAAASNALAEGLPSGVRLVSVGLASVLPDASGTPLMDTPGYPQEYRGFFLGHAAGNDALRAAPAGLDWVVLSPSGDFDHSASDHSASDHEGSRTGSYRVAPADPESRISYADFAIAVLDEIERPRHHRVHIGVEEAR
ncbi:NAD(P)-dependent oxidoreductase [Actinomadura macrotermitis]|uniref:NAD(P)-binding domain-containing protein n=1 Tax=Actinomadura macrotermitis TaxID=2585200 RepID=A0A7K0BXD4_9ACTN|nr:NAD(P)H-binding protein [Actinomadura macrotermitis]MQY05736.1 hypothetical protein [Actinomadura macrotermitis]